MDKQNGLKSERKGIERFSCGNRYFTLLNGKKVSTNGMNGQQMDLIGKERNNCYFWHSYTVDLPSVDRTVRRTIFPMTDCALLSVCFKTLTNSVHNFLKETRH